MSSDPVLPFARKEVPWNWSQTRIQNICSYFFTGTRKQSASNSSSSSSTSSRSHRWPPSPSSQHLMLLALASALLLASSAGSSPLPGPGEEEVVRFRTQPQIYHSKIGDSIQLNCLVDNLGE